MTHNPMPPSVTDSRHALVASAFEALGRSLGPFIDERMAGYFPDELDWATAAANRMGRATEHEANDPLFQLLVLRRFWGPVFADFFGEDLRPLIVQLLEARNLWAHLNLPEDVAYLERCLLAIERLLAPVEPLAVSPVRSLRSALRHAAANPGGTRTPSTVELGLLEAQLSEAEAAFGGLQDRYAQLVEQLEVTRRAAAQKQLRLSVAERHLLELQGLSSKLETTIAEERETHLRIEWLFVSFISVMLLVMVLLIG